MILKSFKISLVLASATFCLQANAGLFDALQQAKDLIGDVGAITGGGQSNRASNANNNSNTPQSEAAYRNQIAGGSAFPFDFAPYPRSTLEGQTFNPFDQVEMPLTPAVKHPSGDNKPRLTLPMEGKVTLLKYSHKGDDSPILIQRFYENWLTEQGFERIYMCQTPCSEMSYGSDMYKILDPAGRAYGSYYPNSPTYIAALKDNAMIVVGVGKDGSSYSSVIKVVEGKILDRSSWDKVRKTSNLSSAPSGANNSAIAKPVAETSNISITSGVNALSADDAFSYVKTVKGNTFVQLSSYDKNCPDCLKANPEYEKFATAMANKGTFLQVTIQPVKDATKTEIALTYNITDLPTVLAFRDGKLIGRHNGMGKVKDLEKNLIK